MENTECANTWRRRATNADKGCRLDRFWGRELEVENVSRERIKKWIGSGLARINGKSCLKPGFKLSGGEDLQLSGTVEQPVITPEAGRIDVVYQDGNLLVIDKPAGLTTHPAPGEPDGTLVNRLAHNFSEIAAMEGQRPGIVHRLDKDTSGVMAVALNEGVRLRLTEIFSRREADKLYLALVHGRPERQSGRIDLPIGRHPKSKVKMAVVNKGGREARSEYHVLWTDRRERASLVAVRIFTGRTHQVRVHMAELGHPLVGDRVYGPQEHAAWIARGGEVSGLAGRQMLHAFRLGMDHPVTEERSLFTVNPPDDFMRLLFALGRDCLRVGLVGMPGSGKSALLAALSGQGVPVFSSDEAVAALYASGGDGAHMIGRRFGPGLLGSGGAVDKAKLFEAMKDSDELRKEVMAMIHPMVEHEIREFFRANAEAPYAVAEIPLLLEGASGLREGVDVVAGIFCPEEKRLGTMRAKRGLDAETMAVFDSWQWGLAEKMRASALLVDNSGTLDDLERKAESLASTLAFVKEGQEERLKRFFERTLREIAEG